MKHPNVDNLPLQRFAKKMDSSIEGGLCLPCVGGTFAGGLTLASNRLHATCHGKNRPKSSIYGSKTFGNCQEVAMFVLFLMFIGIKCKKYPKEIVKLSPTKKKD